MNQSAVANVKLEWESERVEKNHYKCTPINKKLVEKIRSYKQNGKIFIHSNKTVYWQAVKKSENRKVK